MVAKLKKKKLILFVLLAYTYLLIFNSDIAFNAFNETLYFLKEMVFIMPVVFTIIVAIEVFVSKDSISKKLGAGSGFSGNVYSLLLGSLSAGPIYAAFPICKMLLNKGASITNIVIILSSWAVVKVPMLANEVKFLGFEFMYTRWILTVTSIITMSYLINSIVKREDIPLDTNEDLLSVSKNACVGCGLCAKLSPTYFEMVDKKAIVKTLDIKDDDMSTLIDTSTKCPVNAIIIKD